METKQSWRISVKGDNPQMFKDSSIGHRSDGTSYQDTTHGYGYVFFYGTESDCGEKETELFRAGFKILGSGLWEPDTSTAELKKRVKALANKAHDKFRGLVIKNDEKHPELGWYGRIFNGSRNFTQEEDFANSVYKRIWNYYINKFVSPYL